MEGMLYNGLMVWLKRLCVILIATSAFSSCGGTSGRLKIVEGNFLRTRGMRNEASAAYHEALSEPGTAPYAAYALGTDALSLEESDTALEWFAVAENNITTRERNRELLYRIRYNRGIARFQQEEYAAASADFRAALEIDGSRVEAKRNLELSLLSLRQKNERAEQQIVPEPMAAENAALSRGILFDYMRRKESDRWKSWEESTENEEPSGPDY
jgi:Ca-activated chloride channel family protein